METNRQAEWWAEKLGKVEARIVATAANLHGSDSRLDATTGELLSEVFGQVPRNPLRSHDGTITSAPALFDTAQPGHQAAHASLSRALSTLEQKGMLDRSSGPPCSGVVLTSLGLAVGQKLLQDQHTNSKAVAHALTKLKPEQEAILVAAYENHGTDGAADITTGELLVARYDLQAFGAFRDEDGKIVAGNRNVPAGQFGYQAALTQLSAAIGHLVRLSLAEQTSSGYVGFNGIKLTDKGLIAAKRLYESTTGDAA